MRRRFRVSGRVQGVFYRASAEREATRLGVAGFARNERDGTVTVEAEGPPDAVARLEAWCCLGPLRATVTDVAVEDLAPLGTEGFTAR
ncbi:MAG: acylphosphatase [Acidimicrobiia bacterium]|nr:acylphosphatase [Acidimicrobiia bacterium]